MGGLFLIIFISTVVPSIVWFLFVSISVLFLTDNQGSWKKSLVVFLPLSIFISIWAFFGPFGYHTDSGSFPPLSYSVPPSLYNIITQFFLPGFLSLFVLLILSKFFSIKHVFLFSIIVAILTLPFRKLPDLIQPPSGLATNQFVSRQEADVIGEKIFAEIIGEEILLEPKYNSMTLRIKAVIKVPQVGRYEISPFGFNSNLPNISFLAPMSNTPSTRIKLKGSVYDVSSLARFYINGLSYKFGEGIVFQDGNNEVIFDFPVLIGERVLTYPANRAGVETNANKFFRDGTEGTFGPYKFQIAINSFKTDRGDVRFKFISPIYQTKSYVMP